MPKTNGERSARIFQSIFVVMIVVEVNHGVPVVNVIHKIAVLTMEPVFVLD